MPVVSPRNHFQAAVVKVFQSLCLLSPGTFIQTLFTNLEFSFWPSPDFIVEMSENLVSIIHYSGSASESQKKLGPKWENKVQKALILDYCCAMRTIYRIQNSENIDWDSVTDYLRNVKFLSGTKRLFEIVTASQHGFVVPGTGLRFFYNWKIRDIQALDDFEAKWFSPKEIASFKLTGYRDQELFGILAILSETVLKGKLDLFQVIIKNGSSEQIGVMDLLISLNTDTYHILHADGTSPMSFAMGFVYRPVLTEPFKDNLEIYKEMYMTVPKMAKISPTVKSLMSEIWLGIPYALGDLYPSEPFNGLVGDLTGIDPNPKLGSSIKLVSEKSANSSTSSTEHDATNADANADKGGSDIPPIDTTSAYSDDTGLIGTQGLNGRPSPNQRIANPIVIPESISSYELKRMLETANGLRNEIERETRTNVISQPRLRSMVSKLGNVVKNILPAANLILSAKILKELNPEYTTTSKGVSGNISVGPFTVSGKSSTGRSKPQRKLKFSGSGS
jgi:hypothetical protein